ncbi:MAG: hypothetical protein ACRD2J_10810 [Thermoanaerobaculia bacterium]
MIRSRERTWSLWMLTVSPSLWAAHLLASYITAAIWCAKAPVRDVSLGWVRTAILVYTVVALAGIGWMTWVGWRAHRSGGDAPPHDEDTPEDRTQFLGYATLLLSALSAVAVIYAAIVALFFGSCR